MKVLERAFYCRPGVTQRLSTYVLYAVLFTTSVGISTAAVNVTRSHEHRLMHKLFKHYDQTVRPRHDSSQTVNVAVRFSLQQINDLDEKRQILKISGWLTAEWVDEFLTWNPDDYGGLDKIIVEPRLLWVPKLATGNSANKLFDEDHYKRFMITVRHTGFARWQPGGVYAITCALDMVFYPFDDQLCTMEIETWVYTADKVNLTNSLDHVGLDTYVAHGEWTIVKTDVRSINKVYKYYLTESFPEVYVSLHIRRKYTFFVTYVIFPCLLLSGVLLMVFLLPADSGEKVSLGVSILVAISVFLLLVAGNVPDTSDAVPLIAVYLTYFMALTTLSVAFSVLVLKVHYMSPNYAVPSWVERIVLGNIANVLYMKHYDQTTANTVPTQGSGGGGFTSRLRCHRRRKHQSLTCAACNSSIATGRCLSQHYHHHTSYLPCNNSPSPLLPRSAHQHHQSTQVGHMLVGGYQCSSDLEPDCGSSVVLQQQQQHPWNARRTMYRQQHQQLQHQQTTNVGFNSAVCSQEDNATASGQCTSSERDWSVDISPTPPAAAAAATTTRTVNSTSEDFNKVVNHGNHDNEDYSRDQCLATRGQGRNQPQQKWKRVAEVLDRFFFYLFLALLVIPTTTILGFVRLFKPELNVVLE